MKSHISDLLKNTQTVNNQSLISIIDDQAY